MSVNVEALVAKVPTGLLIGSSWRPSSSDEVFDVINPATEEKLAAVRMRLRLWMPRVRYSSSGLLHRHVNAPRFCAAHMS